MNVDEFTAEQWVERQHQDFVGMALRMPGLDESRAAYLSDYANVLRELPNSNARDWDVVLATALHSGYSDLGREAIFTILVGQALEHVHRLMIDTEGDQPNLALGPNQRPADVSVTPVGRTYIYSRIAAAILVERSQPEFAIQLHESVVTLFPRSSTDRVELYPFWLAPGLSFRRLVGLYERVGRFEDALGLSIPQIGYSSSEPDKGYSSAIRRFNGWIEQVLESGAIDDTKRLLDAIQSVILKVPGNDQETRKTLNECPPETRQYWAWFYGYILGQLVLQRPSMRGSLLERIVGDEWSGVRRVAPMLIGANRGSWLDYRDWCLRFYNGSDLSNDSGFPSRLRNLPMIELPVERDPDWATRIGFADAHIHNGQGETVSLDKVVDSLQMIVDVTQSAALRGLRIDRKLDGLSEAVSKGIPPTDEYWRQKLRRDLGETWEMMPSATVDHLVEACRHDYARHSDGVCVAIAKAVESLFRENIVPLIRNGLGSTELILTFLNSAGWSHRHGKDRWDRIPTWGWGLILKSIGPGELNADLGEELVLAFPNCDLESVSRLHTGLSRIAELRGDAAHHPSRSTGELTDAAHELWKIMLGSHDRDGFLTRFFIAFGVAGTELYH